MNRRNEILQEAARLIAEDGVASLTLSSLASRLGMSKQGILHYYASVAALKNAVATWCDEQYSKNYIATIKNIPPHPGRALRVFIDTVLVPYRHQDESLRVAAVALHALEGSVPTNMCAATYRRLIDDCIVDGNDMPYTMTLITTLDALCFNKAFKEALSPAEQEQAWRYAIEQVQKIRSNVNE